MTKKIKRIERLHASIDIIIHLAKFLFVCILPTFLITGTIFTIALITLRNDLNSGALFTQSFTITVSSEDILSFYTPFFNNYFNCCLVTGFIFACVTTLPKITRRVRYLITLNSKLCPRERGKYNTSSLELQGEGE